MGRIAKADPRPALALLYAAHFGHLGLVLPFLPLWIHSRGLSSIAIGVLLALGPLSKLVAPWTWGRLADRTGARREILAGALAAAAAAFAALALLRDFVALFAVMAVYAFFSSPGIPFAEATALEQSESRGFAYGRIRLWGSLAFAVVSVGYGASRAALPADGGFFVGAGLLAVAAVAGFGLPPPTVDSAEAGGSVSARARRPSRGALVRLLAACALMQASHGTYYTFYSIRLHEIGFGEATVGALWALAVLCEVVLLLRIDGILARFGTGTVLRLSLLVAVVRWVTIASASSLPVLAAAQALHALTYAAFHVAALREVYAGFGPSSRATGQAIYSGASYGLGMSGGTLAAGFLADAVGLPWVFAGSAGVALGGWLLIGAFRTPRETIRLPAGT